MIDAMENKVFSRVIRKSRRKGRAKGYAEGFAEGLKKSLENGQIWALVSVLNAKFGSPLSPLALRRISTGSAVDIDRWLVQVLSANRVQDVFN